MGSRVLTVLLLVCCSLCVVSRPLGAQPPAQTPEDNAKLVLDQIRSNKLTAEQALAAGVLTKDLLRYILETPGLLDAHLTFGGTEEERSLQLTRLLMEQEPAVLDHPAQLNATLRLRLARCLMEVPDPRAVDLFESVLAEIKQPEPRWGMEADAALYNLSQYYEEQGKVQQAAEVAMRVKNYTTNTDMLANYLSIAARLYREMGNEEKAAEVTAQVIQLGYGWATAHALCDQAQYLMAKGRHEEARQLLFQPIIGRLADQGRILTLHTLAQSYYETGEWEQARKYARATVKQYDSVDAPVKYHGLEYYVDDARQLQKKIDVWSKTPLVCKPAALRLSEQAGIQHIEAMLMVESYHHFTAMASCENPHVKVPEAATPPESGPFAHFFIVKITPPGDAQPIDATVLIKSPDFPQFELKVPLHIEFR